MSFFEFKDGYLIARNDGEMIRVSPWGKDSFRVEASMMDQIPEGSAALLPLPMCENEVSYENPDELHASISNGNITALLTAGMFNNTWMIRITFTDAEGNILLREIDGINALVRRARLFRGVSSENYRLRVQFEANSGEKIYGMGQYQQELLDLKGASLELAHRNSQVCIPFYLSNKGYGFLWNLASIGEVHFSTNETSWEAESAKKMDYWITAGKRPSDIEQRYADATGHVPMMPEYGLGYWQCKLRYYNQEQVLNVAREYHKRGIPLDVIVIDYYHWLRCGDWKFDEEYWPDPKAMVDELHSYGIEPMVSVWPDCDWRSENFAEMKQQGLLVKNRAGYDLQQLFHGNNAFMDPTNPRTRAYVWEKCKKNYADLGIKTFWLDVAEPEYGTYDYDLFRYHEGSVLEVGNVYPREYSRLFYEGQKESGQEDIVNLVRCAFAGSQRYGALVWSGDIWSSYEDFRKQIAAGIEMGIAGIPWWTTDIGGFHGGNIHDEDFIELLLRWFAYGTFLPVMRMHGNRAPETEIVDRNGEAREHEGAPNEVWSYGEEPLRIMKKFIGIRETLRDYTREAMRDAHEKGNPVIRALFYEFPEDAKCWDIIDQYLYGPDILVAPVCHQHAEERAVYLPTGASWTDAATGNVFEGGQTITVKAPIDTIPVFLRDGRAAELIGQL